MIAGLICGGMIYIVFALLATFFVGLIVLRIRYELEKDYLVYERSLANFSVFLFAGVDLFPLLLFSSEHINTDTKPLLIIISVIFHIFIVLCIICVYSKKEKGLISILSKKRIALEKSGKVTVYLSRNGGSDPKTEEFEHRFQELSDEEQSKWYSEFDEAHRLFHGWSVAIVLTIIFTALLYCVS